GLHIESRCGGKGQRRDAKSATEISWGCRKIDHGRLRGSKRLSSGEYFGQALPGRTQGRRVATKHNCRRIRVDGDGDFWNRYVPGRYFNRPGQFGFKHAG